ncbi:hypothetical protein JCM3765_005791 [Sporobolomyces pararoseus]
MSFSSLPPELVHQIIESTVPYTFHSTTYKERQKTLRFLSLVSKLFRSIAQPLLFEIVSLRLLSDAKRFSAARNSSRERHIVTLVIWRDDIEGGDEAQEEEEKIVESLEVFATVRNITLGRRGQRTLQLLLPMTSHRVSHKPHPVRLLMEGTVPDPPSSQPLQSLCPGYTPSDGFVEDLTKSKLDQLLPQLETLNFTASVWLDPQAGFLHSAAAQTLVDFTLAHTEQLNLSTAHLVHVRLKDTSPVSACFDSGSRIKLVAHLDEWSTLVRTNPSLSLKSVYLDSSLQLSESLPYVTSEALGSLVRVCQERKIEIVFERFPVAYIIDPFISSEFIQRQKEHRRREA